MLWLIHAGGKKALIRICYMHGRHWTILQSQPGYFHWFADLVTPMQYV